MDLSALTDVFAPSEFSAPMAADAVEVYTDAVVSMLADGGPDLVSMGGVARHRQQVPSAVKQRIGGRQAFLEAVVTCFAARWLRWVTRPRPADPAAVRLPRSDDEIHGVRVWRVLRELAEGEARAGRPSLARHLAEVEAAERSALGRHLTAMSGRAPAPAELTVVTYLARGLRDGIAAHEGSLTSVAADEALALAMECLGFVVAPGS